MTAEHPERTDRQVAKRAIFDAIDDHDGEGPPTIGSVIDDALASGSHNISPVLEAFATMHKWGEVYQPKPGYIRRTDKGADD